MPVYDITIVGKAYLPDIGYPLPTPPLGFWGGSSPGVPTQPYPGQGLPGSQPLPGQGLPGSQPLPGQGLPGNQPGLWPSRPPYVDIGGPGPQPLPGQGLPGNQPGLWPIQPPYVDIGFPGPQPGTPGRPSQPIVVPPDIWGGGNEPFPTPPVYIPIPRPGSGEPSQPVNEPPTDSPYWQQVFLPNTGWVWAIVPKPPSGGEVVNPLAR